MEAGRVLEVLGDLPQLTHCLAGPAHILEGDARLLALDDARLAFAEGEDASGTPGASGGASQALEHEVTEGAKQDQRQHPAQHRQDASATGNLAGSVHLAGFQVSEQVRIVHTHGVVVPERGGFGSLSGLGGVSGFVGGQLAGDLVDADRGGLDLPGAQRGLELRVGHFGLGRPQWRAKQHLEQQYRHDHRQQRPEGGPNPPAGGLL